MPQRLPQLLLSLIFFWLFACAAAPSDTLNQPTPEPTRTPAIATPTPTPTETPMTTPTDPPTPPPTPTLNVNQPTPTPEAKPGPTLNLDDVVLQPLPTTPQRVRFTSADGIELAATYYPTGRDQSPTLLLLHMLGSDRESWREFALDGQRQGYSSLALDIRGHGESGGERDFARMDDDVDAALTWLGTETGSDMNNIAILGASIGANLALRAGAAHPELVAVVLLSPGLDYRGITTAEALAGFGGRPLLVVVADGDSYAAESSARLQADAAQGELWRLSGSAHGTTLLNQNRTLSRDILDWLAEYW